MSLEPHSDKIRLKIANLEDEIHTLHRADRLYWSKPDHSREGETSYINRQAQLLNIRRELVALHLDLKLVR